MPDPPCGHPKTPHVCHGDDSPCPPCFFLTERLCACGKKEVGNIRCSLPREKVSCGTVCGKYVEKLSGLVSPISQLFSVGSWDVDSITVNAYVMLMIVGLVFQHAESRASYGKSSRVTFIKPLKGFEQFAVSSSLRRSLPRSVSLLRSRALSISYHPSVSLWESPTVCTLRTEHQQCCGQE